jgi:hypothetical protein
MRLVKEAEKMGILAMRLGSENISALSSQCIQCRPGCAWHMQWQRSRVTARSILGAPPRTSCVPQKSELRKPHALSVSVRLLVNASSQFKYDI